jgi:hypothetical protein
VFSLDTSYILAHWVVLPEAIYVVSYTRKFIIQFDRDMNAENVSYKSPKNVYGHTNNLTCIAHHNGKMYTASVDKSLRTWGKKVYFQIENFKLKKRHFLQLECLGDTSRRCIR